MVAETREHSVDIRGVTATLVDVVVAGHIKELVLSYYVEEADAVHGTPFNDGVDEAVKRGMFHMEGLHADGGVSTPVVDSTTKLHLLETVWWRVCTSPSTLKSRAKTVYVDTARRW